MHLSDYGLTFSSLEAEQAFTRAVNALMRVTGAEEIMARLVVSSIAAYTLRSNADFMTGVADVD